MSNPDLRSFVPSGCRFGANFTVKKNAPIGLQLDIAAQRLGEHIANYKQVLRVEAIDSSFCERAIVADFYVFTPRELFSMLRRAYDAGVDQGEAMTNG